MNINVNRVKIVVMVPRGNVNELREAICLAGAGIIGDYTYCTSSTKSIGTFIPGDGAVPFIGENKKLEFVEEERLEVICDVEYVKNVIKTIREVHPYEEPEIDIYPLLNEEDFK